ncbi:MAG: primosomal protein N' [Ruminococcus sp.]|nr:primosomal protein N' [Ruminococcus sp.]
MEQFLAYVAVENVAYHFDILYSYIIPDEFLDRTKPGIRVSVNFGAGKAERQGIVFSVGKGDADSRYKKILKVLDDKPILSDEMIAVAEFLKDRTFCTYFEAAKVQLPTGFNLKMNVTYIAVTADEDIHLTATEKKIHDFMLSQASFMKKNDILLACDMDESCDALERLVAKGVAVRNYEAVSRVGNLSVKTASLAKDEAEIESIFDSLTDKQKNVVSVLRDVGSASVKEICYFTGVSTAVVSNLAKRGIININNCDVYRIPQVNLIDSNAKADITLTEQQNTAYKNLLEKYHGGGGVSLLYGITGSGKTSVFLKLIDDVLADGKQVIVMVPEISLTPQMMAIFKGRFGSQVAIFHSALSMGERKDEYRRVRDGEAKIAVGTRSAVFAPFDNIGLIVIDEEQEHTYKSESSPRYHARDVAKFRVAWHNALLVLASATPSVETYSLAEKGTYSLEKLSKRYGNAVLPDVTVIDMKNDRARGNKYSISLELQDLLAENLKEKRQSILLINRRGYNTFVACDNCGSVITCPSCSISLTFHRANNRLMCHYCGYSTEFTSKCSKCGKERVRYAGYGTQRIEEELKQLFPEARVLRMDTDSAMSRQVFEKNLTDFGNGDYDIMLGTQMVAKGLNFENVTLVGVINADQQLNNDDFRSEELTFDLLTQVVGRSGRGAKKGVAVIQTITPENNIIRLSQSQDYETFFKNEIAIRKIMTYPPFCDICAVNTVSEDEHLAFSAAKTFLTRMTDLLGGEYRDLKLIILSPMPPRISKVNNKYRYRIIIKCRNNKRFRALISRLLIEFGKCSAYKNVTFTADINPSSLV